MDIVSRLKSFIDLEGMGVSQFADKAGISRPTLSQILSGRNKKISNELIGKLHDTFPTLNVVWLLFGDGEPYTVQNIRFSEPKKGENPPVSKAQSYENEEETNLFSLGNDVQENPPEKSSLQENPMPNEISSSRQPYASVESKENTDNGNFADTDFNPAELLELQAQIKKDPRTQGQPDGLSFTQKGDGQAAKSTQDPKNIQSRKEQKKIMSIIVLYADNSFDTFLPEE